MLLDDGFQHWRLARDLEIVLIDALAPFGPNQHLFPLGRLREPMGALSRAAAFVVTRTEPGRGYDAIVNRLREHNRAAPVFFSRVVPKGWVGAGTVERCDPRGLPHTKLGAFCGLANPSSYWSTLTALEIEPLARWTFGDHHPYKPVDLRRLTTQARAAGIEALLTTEKDAMNISEGALALLSPLKLYWLDITVEVDGATELLSLIRNRLFRAS